MMDGLLVYVYPLAHSRQYIICFWGLNMENIKIFLGASLVSYLETHYGGIIMD